MTTVDVTDGDATEALAGTALTAENRSAEIDAATLGLQEVDLLGFSLGGCVAQEVALVRRRLVRRIVLAGTAPQGAPRIHRWSDDVYALAARDELDPNRFISLFFSGSQESRGKAMEFLKRITARNLDRDEPIDLATRDTQWRRSRAGGSRTRRNSRGSTRSPSRRAWPTATPT
jgi:pimeloyl-ACP methyl ester carboxylesterase